MTMRLSRQLNKDNRGTTLVELVVTFALLALFMVSATFIIVYTTQLYYNTKGETNGLEVSNMISERVIGQIEGAKPSNPPIVTEDANEDSSTDIDSIYFTDATGSKVTITAQAQSVGGVTDGKKYICVRYDEVGEGPVKYDAVDWRFDSNAYMGYEVKALNFEYPGTEYPENVLKMTLTLFSDKYGEYTTEYFIKCANVSKIEYN